MIAKGYWIVRLDVTNVDAFKIYASITPDIIVKYGGKFLVRAGDYGVPEGTTRARNTIIEFPSYARAIECYESDAYQAAINLRKNAAAIDLVIIEGVDFTET